MNKFFLIKHKLFGNILISPRLPHVVEPEQVEPLDRRIKLKERREGEIEHSFLVVSVIIDLWDYLISSNGHASATENVGKRKTNLNWRHNSRACNNELY